MNEDPYRPVRDRLLLHKALPVTPDWSAAPDFLQLIIDHCLAQRPQTILECSSGLTTLALARCCQMNNGGHVYSLENDAVFADATRAVLADFRLQQFADVIQAPLETVASGGDAYQWYSRRELPQAPVDMLVIDGPPGFIQKYSRYPALPLLYSRLAAQCFVFLDDAARPDEREIVDRWSRDWPDLAPEYLDLERGCAVLKRGRPAG